MSRQLFFAQLFGLPLLAILFFVGLMVPRYVPSDTLIRAAASTTSPDLAKERIIASFVGRCRSRWNFDRLRGRGEAKLYSLENDAGLFARTSIHCMPNRGCSVIAKALIAYPFPTEIGGKPLPTTIWGCGRSTPDWSKSDLIT